MSKDLIDHLVAAGAVRPLWLDAIRWAINCFTSFYIYFIQRFFVIFRPDLI